MAAVIGGAEILGPAAGTVGDLPDLTNLDYELSSV